MKFCTNCGAELHGGKFCTECGAPIENVNTENFESTKETEPARLSVRMLVFSIINIVFCFKTLGIISLVLTLLAAEISDRIRAAKYLKIAKILNIIGVCVGVLAIVAVVAYVIFAFFISSILGMQLMSLM